MNKPNYVAIIETIMAIGAIIIMALSYNELCDKLGRLPTIEERNAVRLLRRLFANENPPKDFQMPERFTLETARRILTKRLT